MTILEASGFCAGYGDIDVISDIDLGIHEKEIVVVAGSNGAGKSTFVKSILGLVPRVRGSLRFKGENILGMSTVKRVALGIAYVPQTRNVFRSLTVLENLQVVEGVAHRANRISDLLAIFPGLKSRLSISAGLLSGGERQQLAFARALMTRPALIVLDEPTAALSPSLAATVLKLVQGLPSLETATLLIEQRAQEALTIADRGYVLDSGKIVKAGKARDLLADRDLAALYLGQMDQGNHLPGVQ